MGVNVSGVREARLASTALRNVDAELRRATVAQSRAVLNPIWRDELGGRATSRVDERVLVRGARVNAGARPALVAASSRRPLRGGLVPADEWYAYEFGADRSRTTTYEGRSPQGTRYSVTRHTRRQLPARRKAGRVLYPAVDDAMPRIGSLWAQTSIFLVFRALEGGQQ